jgi:hypothetical protein
MSAASANRRLLAASAAVAIGITPVVLPTLPSAAEPSSGAYIAERDLEYTTYVDPRFGAAITYPSSVFVIDKGNHDQFTKFISMDGLANFYLINMHSDPGWIIEDLAAEAEAAFAQENALITYRRMKNDWFVLSGFISDNIFYRKTIVSNDGKVTSTFQINFPKEQKPFYYDIVERMSWSFKPR